MQEKVRFNITINLLFIRYECGGTCFNFVPRSLSINAVGGRTLTEDIINLFIIKFVDLFIMKLTSHETHIGNDRLST